MFWASTKDQKISVLKIRLNLSQHKSAENSVENNCSHLSNTAKIMMFVSSVCVLSLWWSQTPNCDCASFNIHISPPNKRHNCDCSSFKIHIFTKKGLQLRWKSMICCEFYKDIALRLQFCRTAVIRNALESPKFFPGTEIWIIYQIFCKLYQNTFKQNFSSSSKKYLKELSPNISTKRKLWKHPKILELKM